MKISRYNFGILAEMLAAVYYFFCGYKIIARRMRNYAGEVDLICKKGNILVFVEVKARRFYKNDYDSWMISKKQQSRIIRASTIFAASRNEFFACDIRFDIIIFSLNNFPIIIKNAWM